MLAFGAPAIYRPLVIESAATGVEQLRPRRRRGRRRALIWIGASAATAGVLAATAFLVIIGPLSTYPATTYAEDSTLHLVAGSRSLDFPVGASWTRLGVMPSADTATLVSPDGRYILDVTVLTEGSPLQAALDRAAGEVSTDDPATSWKSERSTGGVVARHRDVVEGDRTKTVVGLERRDGTTVVLIARTTTGDIDRYRPLTASIVGSLGGTP
jgi:hypothetical protein